MNKYTLLLLLLLHFAAINVWGQTDKYYPKAKAFFEKGDYENAEKNYEASKSLWKKKNTSELEITKKCKELKQEADTDYKNGDLTEACDKYKELSKLNPNDGYAKQRIQMCCPKPESSKPQTTNPYQEEFTPAPSPVIPKPAPLPETTLSVSNGAVSFEAYGGEISINVSTNASTWSVSGEIAWCKISKKSETALVLTCEPNTGIYQLKSYFYIQAGDIQQKINIVQEAAENLLAFGDQLFEEKKYDKALDIYTLRADRGDAEAQNRLGKIYAEGIGVEKNPEKAMVWYQKSADQRNATGQNGLGYLYEQQENYKEALKWYLKSANQGFAIAQYNLGLLYEYGLGVKENKKEAEKWYQKSAKQGLPEAKEQLKK
jgi:TPR repeat protein